MVQGKSARYRVEPLTATAMSVIFMHVAFSGMDLAGFVGIIAGVDHIVTSKEEIREDCLTQY